MTGTTFELRDAALSTPLARRADVASQAGLGAVSATMRNAELSPLGAREVARIPRVTIHAFCDTPEVAAAIEVAASDRLMSRAKTSLQLGGIAAAIATYRESPTPNLIIVESRSAESSFVTELDSLAEVCDPGTRVMAIGHTNDIAFYRELMRRGISEYMLAPVEPNSLISAIADLYKDTRSSKLGHVYAFVGAKGGAGSSTVAHNVAWAITHRLSLDVIVADMDLPFGTGGLDFNIDAATGVAEALQDPARLDEVLLDGLLTKCSNNLSLLAAPASLDRSYDLNEATVERLLEVAQASVPFLVMDMPHVWTGWSRNALRTADEIVITATPDLASLRNTKNLVEALRGARPNDPPPKLILNQVGMPKRPEIKLKDFAKAVQLEPTVSIPFDAHLFGTAANNGQMAAEVSLKSPAAKAFTEMADLLTGRQAVKSGRRGTFNLGSLLGRIKR